METNLWSFEEIIYLLALQKNFETDAIGSIFPDVAYRGRLLFQNILSGQAYILILIYNNIYYL